MLLHVIEAAWPVDAAENIRATGAAVDNMNDFVAIVADIQHVRVSDFAQVVRLAAGSGIESSAIENQSPGLRRNSRIHVRRSHLAIHDSGVELFNVGIVIINSVCLHRGLKVYACRARCHASEYLYPVPVLNSTTVSFGLIQPEVASSRVALTVAAPSGAAKIPSSDASSFPS
jgi:hypothetical protein